MVSLCSQIDRFDGSVNTADCLHWLRHEDYNAKEIKAHLRSWSLLFCPSWTVGAILNRVKVKMYLVLVVFSAVTCCFPHFSECWKCKMAARIQTRKTGSDASSRFWPRLVHRTTTVHVTVVGIAFFLLLLLTLRKYKWTLRRLNC